MNLSKKTIFFISGFIFSVLFFGLAGGVQAQTACPSATTPGLLLCEDFEDNSWSDSFDSTYNPENVSIISFSPAQSGSRVARMYGGYLGAGMTKNIAITGNRTIYIKFYQYFPSSWSWSEVSDTGLKQYRAEPSDHAWPSNMYKPGANGLRTHAYFATENGTIPPPVYRDISEPSLGTWHKVEQLIIYNDSGHGGFWWKMDDVLIAGSESFSYVTWPPPNTNSLSWIRVAGGNGFPDGDYYYVDNIEIWDRLPGSSGTQTCSNCCSTTQTCPTAFTTVGTCTRCCSTTCQNASTDTTAPRVTAFTITPTTLTVGASLTANYTVTDNTALARAELWRAPSGTNCTDTVKTGCVWTQVISANITGTSRTGTFTSSPTAAGTFYYGLHAVDTSNNVGYESAAVRVTVNAQTQTCTNCCSTTQTCPTAMTTVGTCTRCCASTCQTASACGNGNCETGETCSSCASDCGACPGGQCQKLSSGSAIPAGYGAPYNTLSSSGEQLMNVVCNANSASVSIGNNSTSQYIYRYGYIWRNNAWQRIDLTGPVPAYEGNWFRGSANATVSLTATELTQENNLIAYICTWNPSTSSGQAGEWKCGCRDSACTTPYWQLQRFGNY